MATPPDTTTYPNFTHSLAPPSPDEDFRDFYETSQFVTGLVLFPIICAGGLTCNGLALIVLSNKKMATSTNTFLSALAAIDIVKLLNDLLYFVDLVLLRVNPDAGKALYAVMYPYSHYIFNQSTSVAAWLTVSVAVERYLFVCQATRARAVCFVSRARVVSAFVFVSMSVAALPSALRYERVAVLNDVTNETSHVIELTKLGSNRNFTIAYDWMQCLLRSIIPLCSLFAFNFCIISALRRRSRLARTKNWRAKNRITVMLIVVIVVFSVCVLPDAVLSTCFRFGYDEEKNLLAKGMREITDALLALSSAVNFIIYCLCNKMFREIFVEIFCRGGGGGCGNGCAGKQLRSMNV